IPLRPAELRSGTKAAWSPDSKRLLFFDLWYVWIAPVDGSEAVQVPSLMTLLAERFQLLGALGSPIPFAWTGTDLFVGLQSPGSRDVWRVPFDAARGVTTGPPVRITTGLNARNGTVQQEKLLFDVQDVQSNVFAFHLAADGKSLHVPPRQITFE